MPKRKLGEKKGSQLTLEEKKRIEELTLEGKMDDYIAKDLGRYIETIRAYRTSVGLVKLPGGGLNPSLDSVKSTSINVANISDEEKIKVWKFNFKVSFRYKRLKDVLSEKELDHFVEQWAQYHLQFEDMKVSEEDMLEQMIMIAIRIDDNNRQRRMFQIEEEKLTAEMAAKVAERKDGLMDLEDQQDHLLHEMLMSVNERSTALTRDVKDLWDKFQQYQKALNATREQREKKEQIGGDTFLSLVRLFYKQEEREKAGEYNELVKKAAKKKGEDLKKPHEFLDGGIEPVILSGKDFLKDKGQKIEE